MNYIVLVMMRNESPNSFKAIEGLLQGCSTSPTLFQIFLEQALKPLKKKCERMGISVRDDYLYILRFEDDQVGHSIR